MRQALASFASDLEPDPSSTEVPARYVDFCPWAGVTLTDGQREVAEAAYDADGRLVVVALVVGRRGGKTYALVALRLLHGMLVRDVSSCAPGQVPTALIVAPNDVLRAEAFNYALGCVQAHPAMRSWLVRVAGSSFELRRPDGALVRFATGVATAGGYGARGRSLTDCAMDEAAFFRSRENKVNDEEIFRAAQPGLLPGGQMIVASSPWASKGLLYELWTRNREGVRDAMVFKRTTLQLRDTPELRRLAEDLRARDPDAASREFDAEFMSASSEIFFPQDLIESCVDDSLVWDAA